MNLETPGAGQTPEEMGVKKIETGLNEVGKQLEQVDPSKMTPEELKVLGAQIEVIFATIAAYAGMKMFEFGFGLAGGDSSHVTGDIAVRLGKVLESALGIIGGTAVVGVGVASFCDGIRKLVKNLSKIQAQKPPTSKPTE